MKKYFILLLICACFSLLQGCSGSSGGSGGFVAPINGSSASSSTVTIAKTTLQFNETTTVTASFLKSTGLPAAGVIVNFSSTLGTLTPSTGIATTDANGNATVQLTAGTTSGQGQVTVSATVDNVLITKNSVFNVTLPQLNLTGMTLGLSTLSFGGSTSVSVTVKDSSGALFTSSPVNVVFTSTQSALGNATINSPVTTVNGIATTTYTANTFSGTDTITATIAGSTATATVTVNSLAAGSITFVSATPKNIGLKGMGGAGITETSLVIFKVSDTAGQPKANQQVDFTLNTAVGGLSLSQVSGSSATDGTVSTIVQAGTIATPVRVTATLRGTSPLIATQSDLLVVSTGVPSQDGMSISIANLNPESYNIDGVTIAVTARLSDHFHNPVPDGTAVSFTTNGGSIQPSCTTVGGSCSVNWISQNPRPVTGPISLVGRATILAYAIGEESFLDSNGNGLADSGVCSAIIIPGVGQAQQCGEFIDTPEAFRDDNFNGVRDAGETFIDFNSDGLFNGPDGIYNGILRPAAVTGPKSKHVFYNSQIVMSTSAANVTVNPNPITGPGEFDVTVTDLNGNTMPSGTTVAISVPFGTVSGITSFTVSQNTGHGQTLPVFVAASATPVAKAGLVTITVTSPGGLITTKLVSISGSF
jgi:hypothetical protein